MAAAAPPRSPLLALATLAAITLPAAPLRAAGAEERPVILVVARGGPGPDRAALEALTARHGRAVFDDDTPRTPGEDPAEAQAGRLRSRARAVALQVRALYYEARPEDAAAMAQGALADTAEPLAYARAITELRELHFWLAVSLAKASRPVEAQRAFERAADLGIAPPEPGLLPPEVTAALEAGLKAAAARPRGRLRVHTMPSGAAVIVDGRAAGRAPLALDLAVGEHYVAAERFGSHPAVRKVHVATAPETLLEVGLEPASVTELGRQIAALRGHGLDLANPEIVGGLARLSGAGEVLTVVSQPAAGHERTTVTRWIPEWRRAAGATTLLPADPGGRRAALLALEDQLWPPPPAPPPSPRPTPWWRRWWVWAAVGGAAVAVGLGAGMAATRPDTYRIVVK
jgi:hypothetical protein